MVTSYILTEFSATPQSGHTPNKKTSHHKTGRYKMQKIRGHDKGTDSDGPLHALEIITIFSSQYVIVRIYVRTKSRHFARNDTNCIHSHSLFVLFVSSSMFFSYRCIFPGTNCIHSTSLFVLFVCSSMFFGYRRIFPGTNCIHSTSLFVLFVSFSMFFGYRRIFPGM